MPVGIVDKTSLKIRTFNADGKYKSGRQVTIGFIKGKQAVPSLVQKHKNKKVKYNLVSPYTSSMNRDNVKPAMYVADITQIID